MFICMKFDTKIRSSPGLLAYRQVSNVSRGEGRVRDGRGWKELREFVDEQKII